MMWWIAGLATATLLILYNFALSLPDLFGAPATKTILFALVLCAGALLSRIMSSVVVALATKKPGRQISQLLILMVGILFFLPVLAADLYFVLQAELAALITTSALATAISGFGVAGNARQSVRRSRDPSGSPIQAWRPCQIQRNQRNP